MTIDTDHLIKQIHEACEMGNHATIRAILELLNDSEAVLVVNSIVNRKTPLHILIDRDDLIGIDMLLGGPPIDIFNFSKELPMMSPFRFAGLRETQNIEILQVSTVIMKNISN